MALLIPCLMALPTAAHPRDVQPANDSFQQFSGRPQERSETEELIRLSRGDVSARIDAAKHLGELKAKRAVPHLIRALDDPNPIVRGWTAWALGEIGDNAAVDALIAALMKSKRPIGPLPFKQRKCLPGFVHALKKISGQDFGFDEKRWVEWNEKRKTKS